MRKRSTWVAWAMLAIFSAGLIFNVALAVANNSVARDPAGVLYLLDFTAFMVDLAAITVLAALQSTLAVGHEGHAIANPIGISGLPHPVRGVAGAVLIGLFTVAALAVRLAGGALSARPWGGAPAAQVVHLRRCPDGPLLGCRGTACSRRG